MDDQVKTGRPSKYEPRFCQMAIDHMSDGASMTSFAAEIGVARSTINEWMTVHPEFSEAIKIAKAKCAAWWERLGRSGAMGGEVNPTLVIFGLKNMAADDWREKQELAHTSPDGSMSPKNYVVDASTIEGLAKLLEG